MQNQNTSTAAMPKWVRPTIATIIVTGCMFVIVRVAIYYDQRNQAKRESYYHQTYDAWCKLEGRADITYIEWTRLRREGLLKHSGR